jgi:hypothetical protein
MNDVQYFKAGTPDILNKSVLKTHNSVFILHFFLKSAPRMLEHAVSPPFADIKSIAVSGVYETIYVPFQVCVHFDWKRFHRYSGPFQR